MSELNTELPTGGMLSGKSKWEVRKTRVLGDWEVWKPGTLEAEYFLDWREAMDYIDEQARTRRWAE